MDPNIRISLAVPDDASSIANLLRDAFAEFEPLYTPEGLAATTPNSDKIRSRMDEGPTWVALQDDVVVGTVSALPKGQALYVRSMAVLPSARGQGTGKLLLDLVENFAREHGFQRMFLSTTPFLLSAIALYERAGFHRTDDGPHDLFGTPLFTMVKVLQASA